MTVAIGDKQVRGHGTPVGPQSYFPVDQVPASPGPDAEDQVQVSDTPTDKKAARAAEKSGESDDSSD